MPGKEPDKMHREIEELLDKLDTFVPEERLAAKIKSRRRQEKAAARTGPTLAERATRRLSNITLGHLMIAGLALMLIAWLFGRALPDGVGTWAMLLGIVLTGAAFVLSVLTHGGARTTVGGRHVQKRWRGQVIEYSEPSPMDRIREWLRRRGRR